MAKGWQFFSKYGPARKDDEMFGLKFKKMTGKRGPGWYWLPGSKGGEK